MSFSSPFTFSPSIQKHRFQIFPLKLTITPFTGDNISKLVFFGTLASQSFYVFVPLSRIILPVPFVCGFYLYTVWMCSRVSTVTLITRLNMYKWCAIYTITTFFSNLKFILHFVRFCSFVNCFYFYWFCVQTFVFVINAMS